MALRANMKKTRVVFICILLVSALCVAVPVAGCGGGTATAAKDESRRAAKVKPAKLPALVVKQLPSGDRVISLPSDLYFAFDSAALSRTARSQLENELLPRVRTFLAGAGNHVVLRGFTDGSGTAAYNAALSERRAAAVRSLLIAAGVPSARVSARGFGEELATSSEPDQSLRRVDVVFRKGGLQ